MAGREGNYLLTYESWYKSAISEYSNLPGRLTADKIVERSSRRGDPVKMTLDGRLALLEIISLLVVTTLLLLR